MSAWDWQLINIYNKGISAFERGEKREPCPYPWARTGFARQRHDYWMKGFDDAAQMASDQRIFDKARSGKSRSVSRLILSLLDNK